VLFAGDLFEDMFYSARIGVMKPQQAFFDFAAARIGPQDEQPLFFDDTPKMIEGARRYGWEAVPFNTLEDFTLHPWVAARLAQT
jgi:putative hydrolase of the HAD superfamily